MAFLLLIFGALLFVVGYRGTQSDLAKQLGQDVPGFMGWAGAIIALSMIGFLPGMKTISRAFLGLVALVVFLRGYQNIIAGFQAAFSSANVSTSQAPASSANQFAAEVTASGFQTGVSSQDAYASATGSGSPSSGAVSSLASAAGSILPTGGGSVSSLLGLTLSSAGLGSLVNQGVSQVASIASSSSAAGGSAIGAASPAAAIASPAQVGASNLIAAQTGGSVARLGITFSALQQLIAANQAAYDAGHPLTRAPGAYDPATGTSGYGQGAAASQGDAGGLGNS